MLHERSGESATESCVGKSERDASVGELSDLQIEEIRIRDVVRTRAAVGIGASLSATIGATHGDGGEVLALDELGHGTHAGHGVDQLCGVRSRRLKRYGASRAAGESGPRRYVIGSGRRVERAVEVAAGILRHLPGEPGGL